MAKTVKLVLEVVIEIIEWFKTRENKENGGSKHDRKRNRKKKSKG
jgi:hypothetical protein